MPSEFPVNNPRSIWQNQPTEPFKMSADEMRRKAQQLQRKARLVALTWITTGILLCVGFARTFARAQDVVPRIGWGLLSLWGIYGAYQAYKWIWPRKLAPDATVSTSLAFYRSELERQRDYGRHLWRRSGLTFCFLGLAMVVVPALMRSLETPTAPAEHRAILCPSRDMDCAFLSHEEAKSAEASTGDRGVARVREREPMTGDCHALLAMASR